MRKTGTIQMQTKNLPISKLSRTKNLLYFRYSALEMLERAKTDEERKDWGELSLYYKELLDKLE